MDLDSLKALLRQQEGTRLKPYFDCCGKFFRECTCEKQGKLTLATGRNIEDVGISEAENSIMLDNDITKVVSQCREAFPWFNSLCDTRQNVLCSMALMGIERLKGFTKMLAAIARADYEAAANEILCSRYAATVGKRAVELAQMMREGSLIH